MFVVHYRSYLFIPEFPLENIPVPDLFTLNLGKSQLNTLSGALLFQIECCVFAHCLFGH